MLKKKGLGAKLASLFGRTAKNEAIYEELEDLLVESDLGALSAMEAVDRLRDRMGRSGSVSKEEIIEVMKDILGEHLTVQPLDPEPGRLNLFLGSISPSLIRLLWTL